MNADHKFAALDWNYASVLDTADHSELKLIDGDFPTVEITRINLQMRDYVLPEHWFCKSQ